MQPMSFAKRKNRRQRAAANANPANPESPWRSLGYEPGNEAAYDPAPRTVCASVQTFAPEDYLVYERRGGRTLPPRHPSRAERDHKDWPKSGGI